ncbi:hypothetical protein A4X13_0g5389 [Tilletia indica]|uniref:Alpha-ketoglutarate-dependent dioxygenase AlkB-like domain-containing protein n=1 Tax=Tilletia indica TaxID=43049 RepID=A0A177TH87_9BASI|nr:hypothetical protein A4X13_0g5389 [Tilletia indica]
MSSGVDSESGLNSSQTRSSMTLAEARLAEPGPSSLVTASAESSAGNGGSENNPKEVALSGDQEAIGPMGGFFYFPDFISEQEEEYLLQQIQDAPALKWKILQNRRLQTWGGHLAGTGGNTLIPQPLPSFFTSFPDLIKRLADTGAFNGSKHGEANHCLVNEYLSGQGIMPHEDGGAYFPAVATISLGSHTLLDIYRYAEEPPSGTAQGEASGDTASKEGNEAATKTATEAQSEAPAARAREKDPAFSILQERRSLLITLGSAYRQYLHGIAERHVDEPEHLRSVINLHQLGDSVLKERVVQLLESGSSTPSASKKSTEDSEKDTGTATLVSNTTTDTEALPATPLQGLQRETRVSLTFRDVEKVSMGLQKLLGRGGGKR